MGDSAHREPAPAVGERHHPVRGAIHDRNHRDERVVRAAGRRIDPAVLAGIHVLIVFPPFLGCLLWVVLEANPTLVLAWVIAERSWKLAGDYVYSPSWYWSTRWDLGLLLNARAIASLPRFDFPRARAMRNKRCSSG